MYCWTFVQDEDTYTIYINHNLKSIINLMIMKIKMITMMIIIM